MKSVHHEEEHEERVVPAWTVGTQVDRDVSGRILRAWMPAIHAGMTIICIFTYLCVIMNHFAVNENSAGYLQRSLKGL